MSCRTIKTTRLYNKVCCCNTLQHCQHQPK